MSKPLTLAVALLLGSAGAAWPCGGPYVFVPSLQPAAETLTTDDYGADVEPFRFLDPFRLANLHQGGLLAGIAYQGADLPAESPAAADIGAMDRALGSGDRAATRDAALRVIDTLLSLPALLADPWADDLRRAVEFVEVEPALGDTAAEQVAAVFRGTAEHGGTPLLNQVLSIRASPFDQAAETLAHFPDSPRRPSLELAVLRNRMTAEIGNGWPGQIQGTAPETWSALLAAHDDWLARYPVHPLADLARLQRLRVLYLQGDGPSAWGLLLDLYGRRPARALWEMRHLLLNGMTPKDLDLASLPDPVLASALLGQVPAPSPAQWDALWQRSEKAAGAPWAVNLDERLLLVAATREDRTLPTGFPAQAAKPTELWAQLRTLALERAGRYQEALHQGELLDAKRNAQSAAIQATALVSVGQTTRAADLPALDEDTAAYLLHVTADDADLATMVKGRGPRAAVAAEALAGRRLGKGDWAAGARILDAADPERATRWREAGRQAADHSPAGRLALAEWLLERRGELFRDYDTGTSRGLKRLLDTELTAPQRERLADRLTPRRGAPARPRRLRGRVEGTEPVGPKGSGCAGGGGSTL